MFVHDKHELFSETPLIEQCVLGSGKTVLMRAMSPADLAALRDRTAHVTDEQEFAYHGLVQCVVHPETYEPLFDESDVPRMRDHMHLRDLYPMVETFNRIHGFTANETEELDPVKKPSNGLVTGTSGTG